MEEAELVPEATLDGDLPVHHAEEAATPQAQGIAPLKDGPLVVVTDSLVGGTGGSRLAASYLAAAMTFRNHLIPILMGLLIAGPGVAAEPPGETSIFLRYSALNSTVERASQEVTAHHFGEARRRLEPCLVKVPDHFEAHYLLARMAYEERDFAGALSHLERSEHSLADLERRYREEMAALAAQADAEELATQSSLDYLTARGGDPGGCSAILYEVKQSDLAFLKSKKGDIYKSENPFEVPADYHFLHGNCCYRLGRRDEAMTQYRLAVRQDLGHANAWNNLISLQWEMRAYAAARADLDRAETAHVAIRPGLKQAVLAASAVVTPATEKAAEPAMSVDPHR